MTIPADTEPLVIESHSPEETEALGKCLGTMLPDGCVVALHGDLAAGKTCLVRGMAGLYATDEVVSSPTFTLVNQYGRLYHVDLYRLENARELLDLGYEDLFEPEGVCLVEWAERAGPLLPEQRVDIVLEHIDENTRRIAISDRGLLPEGWKAALTPAR